MDVETTAKEVESEVLESKVEFEGIDYPEVAKYLAMNMKPEEIKKMKLEQIIPDRVSVKGARPGPTTEEARKGKDDKYITKWTFTGKREATEKEKKIMLARALRIGIEVSFRNYTYTFGGKVYVQMSGGPIGSRLTMACARIVMCRWGKRVRQALKEGEVETLMDGIYVDDVRTLILVQEKTWFWSEEEKKYERREQEDNELTRKEHTVQEFNKMLNSLMIKIKFTTETEEDFENKYIPTLDTQMKVLRSGRIVYKFYEKPMASSHTIPNRSAMNEGSKRTILSQEIVRRMKNTRVGVEQEIHDEPENIFSEKMRRSGYSRRKIREIITGGLVNYEK